ncbi:MAG: hydrogenase nickel incorporation protein HypB [Candidatus Brocadiaceae bacterium]|jgi:hydrogenase nickel incorporation protein HypB
MKKVDLRRSARESNDAIAARNRERFAQNDVYVLNMIGSPGCGKTSILEQTARHFDGRFAAVIGDVQTALDAERIVACGIETRAIETGGSCHLNAAQIEAAVEDLDLEAFDFLFIENVGNLVCPSGFDLGEDAKAAVLSVPEGDEKIRKYPALFVRADVLFINKIDLLEHCPFDVERVRADARKVHAGVNVFETSATQGTGFEPWFEFLRTVQGRSRGGQQAQSVTS